MDKFTGLQVVYLGQVSKVIAGLNVALAEAKFLKAKSHDNTREQKEATKMVEDLERWLNYAEQYIEFVRERPDRMFAG